MLLEEKLGIVIYSLLHIYFMCDSYYLQRYIEHGFEKYIYLDHAIFTANSNEKLLHEYQALR